MMSKNWLKLIAGCCAVAFVGNVCADTLYEQEGGVNDQDGVEVNAAGVMDSSPSASYTNWKYQTGGGSWSGVYATTDGWVTASESGDMSLKVEADVEMYFSQSCSKNEIYFHIGNVYTATAADCTAEVTGTFSSNNGQYIGISFFGTDKVAADFEKDDTGALTGRILNGMQSDHDTYRAQNNQMDITILLNWGTGWQTPVNFGAGAHDTIESSLWWLVGNGAPGTYNYTWMVQIHPEAHQADGDYYLDPVIVASPVL